MNDHNRIRFKCPMCGKGMMLLLSIGFPGPPEAFRYACNNPECSFNMGGRPEIQQKVQDILIMSEMYEEERRRHRYDYKQDLKDLSYSFSGCLNGWRYKL